MIKGWDLGVATMCRGEKAVFTIREDYAYGKAGKQPQIPPGATLMFEVELCKLLACSSSRGHFHGFNGTPLTFQATLTERTSRKRETKGS